MPVEMRLWRLKDKDNAVPVALSSMDSEERLERILSENPSILGWDLLLIGRQVETDYGHRIDLLALDGDGRVVVIELKRDRTPRDVVAQLLDYGAWVRTIRGDELGDIFRQFLARYHREPADTSLEEEFCKHFGVDGLPEDFGESHTLMVVASELDLATERIINYLAEEYEVAINAVFFRCFRDGDREYLTRTWLIDPERVPTGPSRAPWNGQYYVKFHHRDHGSRHWEDARKYGFVSANDATFETRTLRLLEPERRIWVHIPAKGYVGTGRVTEGPLPAEEFVIEDENGNAMPITEAELEGNLRTPEDNPADSRELLVRVKWDRTVPIAEAVWEQLFFWAATTVARPRTEKWETTLGVLKKRWSIGE